MKNRRADEPWAEKLPRDTALIAAARMDVKALAALVREDVTRLTPLVREACPGNMAAVVRIDDELFG